MVLKKGYIFSYINQPEVDGSDSSVEQTRFRVIRHMATKETEDGTFFVVLAVPINMFEGLIDEPIELVFKEEHVTIDVAGTFEAVKGNSHAK